MAVSLFSLAGRLSTEITSFQKLKAVQVNPALKHELIKRELYKLAKAMETIRLVLLEAERKQYQFISVENWIRRLRGVMYDAEDLLDEMVTYALFNPQVKRYKLSLKVRVSFFMMSLSKKIRKLINEFDKIREDTTGLAFIGFIANSCEMEISDHAGPFVNDKVVFGRDDDKEAILKFLFDKSDIQSASVIAIVGIGGIGKTTLAQLVYNDEEIGIHFEKRYWVRLSFKFFEKEILERIFECISMKNNSHRFTISRLYYEIKELLNSSRNYLLVLDDVWNGDVRLWFKVVSLLGSGSTGSRVVITTRSTSVAAAAGADKTYFLSGLAEAESWQMFKTVAFQRGQEENAQRITLGKEIVRMYGGVPIAIEIIASVLRANNTMQEWESVKCNQRIYRGNDEVIMSVLKLSYDLLPPILKSCLAYCSLFPEDYVFRKEELIYLWISGGLMMQKSYSDPLEEMGHRCFMELLNRSYFQEATVNEYGEVVRCKMHDHIHDFARFVAGDESIMITEQPRRNHPKIRHLGVDCETDRSWNIPLSLFQACLRSLLFFRRGSLIPLVLDNLLTRFKLLRALNLGYQEMQVVPNSITKLVHLRYLNLSHNRFTNLPDSITMLVNLLTLDISWCPDFELFPEDFTKLKGLRHLDIKGCYRLRYMPPDFEELISLRHLSFFKVGKEMGANNSRLNSLAKLKLEGELEIMFDQDVDCDDEGSWQLPIDLRKLTVENYQGERLPHLETEDPSGLLRNLVSICIGQSSKIKQISPLRSLPSLQNLQVSNLNQLEYIEIEEDENKSRQSARSTTDNALFFRSLKALKLEGLPGLKGWLKEVEATFKSQGTSTEVTEDTSCMYLPVLSDLSVKYCPQLKLMPLCPCLQKLELNDVNETLVQQLLSTPSNTSLSSLKTLAIWDCDLHSFPGRTLTSLHHLEVAFCDELEYLDLAPPESNILEELVIRSCRNLDLWDKEKKGVDWDSLTELSRLLVAEMPNPKGLPDCLQKRLTIGKLRMIME